MVYSCLFRCFLYDWTNSFLFFLFVSYTTEPILFYFFCLFPIRLNQFFFIFFVCFLSDWTNYFLFFLFVSYPTEPIIFFSLKLKVALHFAKKMVLLVRLWAWDFCRVLVKKLESIIRHWNGERIILVVLAHFHRSFKTSQQKRLEFFYFFIIYNRNTLLCENAYLERTIHHRIDSERRNRTA